MATSADGIAASGDRSVVTTPVGRLAEFSPDTGSIEVYIERFEVFASANNIDEPRKAQVFLTVLGEKAYVTLRSLLLPKSPADSKYADITKVLREHYAPRRSIVTERYRFHRRDQGQSETIGEFVVELKKLAATCEFGSFLEESLRDRLISGLRSEDIRCRLLSLPNKQATWERVLNIATAMETAKNDTKEILPAPADVNWQNKPTPKRKPMSKSKTASTMGTATCKPGKPRKEGLSREGQGKCFRCGDEHFARACPFLQSQCFKCSKKGHVAKMCRTKQTHCIDQSTTEAKLLAIGHNQRDGQTSPLVVKLHINGKEVPMELDTGSAVSLMSESEFEKRFPDAEWSATDVRLVTYNGTPVNVKGSAQVDMSYGTQRHELPLVIVKHESGLRMPTLFGRNWLSKIRLY